ncbi:MAG: hypothetical protein KQJ78_16400 [Deltaproteobacteria bacterium]|nr:hypothetical protein [Deltaproteobacteria bacterium]
MRIGSEAIFRNMTLDLGRIVSRQMEIQKAVLTGRTVNAPSDAEGQVITILNDHNLLAHISQYRSNLESADSWMEASEDNMNDIKDLLTRARTLAEQMSTGTYSATEYNNSTAEVDNLIEQLITLGNSVVNGSYIFAGTRTDVPPLTSYLMPDDDPQYLQDGHGTTATVVEEPLGSNMWRLQLGTDTDPITLGRDNTLGDSVGLINFDNWTPPTISSLQYQTLDAVVALNQAAAQATVISSAAGEELRWTGIDGAGQQVYRTEAVFTPVGGDTVSIDGVALPAFADASELVNLINAQNDPGHIAWLDSGTGEVHVMGTGTGPFTVLHNGLAVDTATLGDVEAALNSGVQATGFLQIDGTAWPGTPAPDDASWDPPQTVTLGDQTWTWPEITSYYVAAGNPAPATASDYGDALAYWVNNNPAANAGAFTAEVVADPATDRAVVQLRGVEPGAMNNLTLTASSDSGVTTSGALFGGMDGTGGTTTGRIYAKGTSDVLDLETKLQIEVVDVQAEDVRVRVSWYDNDGAAQSREVVIPAEGEENAINVPGLGDISLYRERDGAAFQPGAVFEIVLGHYQGNEEDLGVSLSEANRMTYNWNCNDILGGPLSVALGGAEAAADTGNTGPNQLFMDGVYREGLARDYHFRVVSGGNIPADPVTVEVSWQGADGVSQYQEVTVTASGQGGRVELPGADGAYFYLENGNYVAGDGYDMSFPERAISALDVMNNWKKAMAEANADDTASMEKAQTMSQKALEALESTMQFLMDSMSELGVRRDRIIVRESVMDEQQIAAESDLEILEQVDLTSALLELNLQQTAYNACLKVSAALDDLSLVKLI